MGFFDSLFYYIGIICIFRGLFIFYRWVISYVCSPVDLKSKYKCNWALITGANSGLGKFIAIRLAKQGYNIIGTGRNVQSLATAKSEIEGLGVQFLSVQADFSDKSGVDTVIEAIKDKDVGIGIINAGFGIFGKTSNIQDEEIHSFITTMCTSYAQLAKYFVTVSEKRESRTLLYFTASLAAHVYTPLGTLYASVKSYDSTLAKHISLEKCDGKLDVSVMHPGFFLKSGFFSNLPEFLDRLFAHSTSLYPSSEEVADCVIKTLGRTTIVDCSGSSLLARFVVWICGELPTSYMCKMLIKMVPAESKKKVD